MDSRARAPPGSRAAALWKLADRTSRVYRRCSTRRTSRARARTGRIIARWTGPAARGSRPRSFRWDSDMVCREATHRSRRPPNIRLTSHPVEDSEHRHPFAGGRADPRAQRPGDGTNSNRSQRNVIGTTADPMACIARARGGGRRADARSARPHQHRCPPSDRSTSVGRSGQDGLDPRSFGGRVFRGRNHAKGLRRAPTIATDPPEVHRRHRRGGVSPTHPPVCQRIGRGDQRPRAGGGGSPASRDGSASRGRPCRALFEETGGMYRARDARRPRRVPPAHRRPDRVRAGRPRRIANPDVTSPRVHDERNGSVVFGSDIRTCSAVSHAMPSSDPAIQRPTRQQ